MIHAYTVHTGEPSEQAVVVFAHTAREAKRLGYRLLDEVDRFVDVVAQRSDELALPLSIPWPTEPRALDWYRAADRAVYRAIGFHCEGESACDACELYPCGDDAHALCAACDQCPECGHHPTECTDAWVSDVTPLWQRQWDAAREAPAYVELVFVSFLRPPHDRLIAKVADTGAVIELERWKVQGERPPAEQVLSHPEPARA